MDVLRNRSQPVPCDKPDGVCGMLMMENANETTSKYGRQNCTDLKEPDYVFVILSLSLLFVAIGAVFFNFLFLSLLRQTAIFHQNVRSLLVNAELGTTLAAGCLVLRATFYHWPLAALGFDHLALHSSSCTLLESLCIIGVVSMILSLAGIGCERLCATWRWMSATRKTYFPKSRTISRRGVGNGSLGAVGVKRRRTLHHLSRQRSALSGITDQSNPDQIGPYVKGYIAATWMVGIGYVGIFYWSGLYLDQTLCYCHIALAVQEHVLYGTMVSWLTLSMFTLLLYCLVLRRNRRHLLDFTINTARHNLQERFMAWHNVTITAMLLPAAITNAVLSGVFFTALMPVYGWYNDFRRSADSILGLVAILHILAAAMLLNPILTTRSCEKLRMVACKQYPLLKRLWLVGQAKSSGKFSTTSMRGITIGEPKRSQSEHNTMVGTAGATELTETGTGSKRKPSDSVIVDYRIDPDQHRQLIERLWSMKD